MTRSSIKLPRDPLWYKDAIIYEVHIKSFFDGNNDGIGDFVGLIQKLDYLQELGINCIWLLPFYPSPLRDDGYDISDYTNVHASYGTLRDFRLFIREAHRRGIRVITELVINHTSDQHPWFQAARKAPKGSTKRDYYVWSANNQKYKDARIIFKDYEKSNWSWDESAKAYYWHRFFAHQPDLNFENPHVRRAIMRVMRFWLDMGVDGMRLDAVPYLIEREGTSCENLPETHAVLKAMRKELDAHYKDRMFLAEANQWPVDVRPYFGDGDECHMAFHFPLMPRIFMALRQEDRHPITDILRQTPDIPESCQWAIFLRNHDELTLEMVTDAERDYLYAAYASDPLMRLNLGIRRRLAPLVNNSRRRLELLNSLLFSFPGTPVLYYGDEIGMGDNYYLGDRNGVRTPMQWSSDRNGGFSRADFARLYTPPIMDSIYGYGAVNVEAQLRDPSSLLNWTKRMISISKRFKTFGRGKLEFLNPTNRKVLAYVRRYGDETFLAVTNLSRFVQPAELNLSEFTDRRPVEMLGSVEFPAIGKDPYFITLGPHSFYWFLLQRVRQRIEVSTAAVAPTPEKQPPPVLVAVNGKSKDVSIDPYRAALESQALVPYLNQKRWFGGKAKKIENVRVANLVRCPGDIPTWIVFAEVRYTEGPPETYLLPLRIAVADAAQNIESISTEAIVAHLKGAHEGVLYDALLQDDFCRQLLSAIEQSQEWPCLAGSVVARPSQILAALQASEPATEPIARLMGEQSNTCIRFGRKYVLKWFRRLDEGLNPDVEVGRYLTEKASFSRIPRIAGDIHFHAPDGTTGSLAMLSESIENQGSGWDHALDALARFYDRISGRMGELDRMRTVEALPTKLSTMEPSPLAQEWAGSYLYAAGLLGKRTAELHRALAQPTKDPAFKPESFTSKDAQAYATKTRAYAGTVFQTLEQQMSTLPEVARAKAQQVLAARERLRPHLADQSLALPRGRIRCHGDYHLGQVLWTNNDFTILDFEGEPARPLAERRLKASPLKDVAGMLRSFHYAAYAGLLKASANRPADFNRFEPAAKFWYSWVALTFLKEYRQAAEAEFCPQDPAVLGPLLDLFLLDKTLYEVLYELNNRPTWIGIPLEGLLNLLPVAAEASHS